MKLKLNWGTGIAIVIAIFMIITIATVVYLMNQDVELVTDDYYKKELKYQNQIERIERTNELDEKLQIIYSKDAIKLILPSGQIGRQITGEIHLYRPSDSKMDINIPLSADSSGLQLIPVARLAKGYWKVKILWETIDNDYYTEKSVMIN